MGSMSRDLREEVEHDGPCDNQADPNHGRQIELLPVKKPSNDGDEHGADARPDSISHTERKGFQCQGEAEEGGPVSRHDQEGGCESGEVFRCLQAGGGDDFCNDCEKKQEIGFHRGSSVKLRMKPAVGEAVSGAVSGTGVDLLVGMDDRLPPLRLADPVAEIVDEFLQGTHLCLCRLVTVEVSDQTNAEGDVIEVITRHMAAVDLPCPSRSDLDLPVTGAMAVTDHKMVGQSVLHVADALVVDVEDAGIPLARSAVVNHDVFPATLPNRSAVDRGTGGGREVVIAFV